MAIKEIVALWREGVRQSNTKLDAVSLTTQYIFFLVGNYLKSGNMRPSGKQRKSAHSDLVTIVALLVIHTLKQPKKHNKITYAIKLSGLNHQVNHDKL